MSALDFRTDEELAGELEDLIDAAWAAIDPIWDLSPDAHTRLGDLLNDAIEVVWELQRRSRSST